MRDKIFIGVVIFFTLWIVSWPFSLNPYYISNGYVQFICDFNNVLSTIFIEGAKGAILLAVCMLVGKAALWLIEPR